MATKLALAAAIASGAVLAVPAVASAAPRSGTEYVRIVSTSLSGAPGSIIARGLFTAGGRDYTGNNKDVAVFPGGGFTIHHPRADGTGTGTLNPSTCVARFSGSGTYSVNGGFGAYRGITGTGTYKVNTIATLPRKANGTCNTSGLPTASQTVVVASGPVSF